MGSVRAGVDTADERVKRQLSDRNAHSADALVAQAEDALPVGHHDDVDVALGPVLQHLVQMVALRVGNEQSPWPAVDLTETLAGFTDGRGVDDRQGLGNVIPQHPVEQGLVAILQRAQINVLVEVVASGGELMPTMRGLLVQGLHRSRQQPQQTVLAALALRKGRALGRQRIEKNGLPSLFVTHARHPFRCNRVVGAYGDRR